MKQLVFFQILVVAFAMVVAWHPFKVSHSHSDDETKAIRETLSNLIDMGESTAKLAHDKLKRTQLNAYNKLLIEQLDYLELLIKRGKGYLQYLENPFMNKLVHYLIEDLDSLCMFFQTLLKLYDQGNDLSMPVLTNLINEIIEQSNIDIAWLSTHDHFQESQALSKQTSKISKDLHDLKQLDLYRDTDQVFARVRNITREMILFQNMVLFYEQKFNVNAVNYIVNETWSNSFLVM